MTWKETNGTKPRTDALLQLRFRNGLESKKAYPVDAIRWSHLGDDWDVIAARRANAPDKSDNTWAPVSGGY